MLEDTAIVAPTPEEQALSRLTLDERVELERYRRSGKPDLSVVTSTRLYELWLQGVTCEELSRQNAALSLGCILKARVDHQWDRRRDAYLDDLMSGVGDRLRQIGAESVNFMGIVLAAAHKEQGEKLKKYLQTGDPTDLGELHVLSFSQYKSVVETLVRLTGGDKPKPSVALSSLPSAPVERVVDVQSRPMTPEEADRMRAAKLLKKREEP